jgi:hypothetical protein
MLTSAVTFLNDDLFCVVLGALYWFSLLTRSNNCKLWHKCIEYLRLFMTVDVLHVVINLSWYLVCFVGSYNKAS